MIKIFIILHSLFLFVSSAGAAPLEVDITRGKIEPLPIAITKFNYENNTEKEFSDKIFKIISYDLESSGFFRKLSNEAFLQNEKEVFDLPYFSDWRLIDANLIVSGNIKILDGKIEIKLKLWDVYAEKVVLSKKIAGVSISNWRFLSHILSNIIYEKATGEKGYFDTKIVYVSEQGEYNKKIKRIAIMDYDGENHYYLTDGKELVLTPRFSPNGKDIVYLSYKNNRPSVYILNLLTKETKILGNFDGMSFAPRFSSDAKQIIFSLTKRGSSNIFMLNVLDDKVSQITNNRYINTSPYFSPSGKEIVFSSDRAGKQNIYILKLSPTFNSKPRRITYGKGNYATPVWSPRGDLIAFTKTVNKKFYIGVINTNGKNERLIAEGYLAEGPSWSPNGRTLIYYKINKRNDKEKASKLYTIDITGNLERVLKTPDEASDPDWGPSIKY